VTGSGGAPVDFGVVASVRSRSAGAAVFTTWQ